MSSKQMNKIRESIGRIPDSPGVYIMKNDKGKPIYVGKAKNLKNRVRNYLQPAKNLDAKTRAMIGRAETVDYIATGNEIEALVLECNLIKEYRPRYNIQLKDDKRYPYIKLTVDEKFPRILLVRKIENDGAEYFGPYTDTRAVRNTMRLVNSVFMLRSCPGKEIAPARERECLNFQIRRCIGPCTGRITPAEYSKVVDQVRLFLKGKNDSLLRLLERRMKRLSAGRRYEEASVVRDQIRSLDKLRQKQQAISAGGHDEDIIALSTEGDRACGVVLRVREGKILGSESFIMPGIASDDISAIYNAFFELYYHSATDIPPLIYSQYPLSEKNLAEDWLSEKTGRRVKIRVPARGARKRLVEIAERNSAMKLVVETGRKSDMVALLVEVKKTLGLPSTPFLIEGYDISNIHGSNSVGSMVTFRNAIPLKSGYRHFRIRMVDGIDDFAMMGEVLTRRFERIRSGGTRRPDLVLVDGGKGQVSAALKAIESTGVSGIPVIGLAKRNEEIILPGNPDPLRLPSRSPVLRLLQRIRDESHRFAVDYHRKLRSGDIRRSALDDVEGIGEKRKIRLLVEFGSLENMKKATVEEIGSVQGIGDKIARKIFRQIHR